MFTSELPYFPSRLHIHSFLRDDEVILPEALELDVILRQIGEFPIAIFLVMSELPVIACFPLLIFFLANPMPTVRLEFSLIADVALVDQLSLAFELIVLEGPTVLDFDLVISEDAELPPPETQCLEAPDIYDSLLVSFIHVVSRSLSRLLPVLKDIHSQCGAFQGLDQYIWVCFELLLIYDDCQLDPFADTFVVDDLAQVALADVLLCVCRLFQIIIDCHSDSSQVLIELPLYVLPLGQVPSLEEAQELADIHCFSILVKPIELKFQVLADLSLVQGLYIAPLADRGMRLSSRTFILLASISPKKSVYKTHNFLQMNRFISLLEDLMFALTAKDTKLVNG